MVSKIIFWIIIAGIVVLVFSLPALQWLGTLFEWVGWGIKKIGNFIGG
jgi:hypothetical protein